MKTTNLKLAAFVALTCCATLGAAQPFGGAEQNERGNAVGAAPDGRFDGQKPTAGLGGGPGNFGGPGGRRNAAVDYVGATEFKESTQSEGERYESETSPENALLVSGGESTVKDATVVKTGAPEGRSDDYDFYGTNAAVLVRQGKLTLHGGRIETNAAYANALFACGEASEIDAEKVRIHTREHNSGGVMVTSGGTLTARDFNVVTEGGSSAAIRSDRGGGLLTVIGGEFVSNGPGSPAIYSTADIRVENAILNSTRSEGAIIEGRNSITLRKTKLYDDNNVLHGKSSTYKNVFIYQSFSGDAAVGTSNFTAEDSEIVTKKGDSIYVTNTRCTIDLRRVKFVNEDPEGWFLRLKRDGWGRKGANGGKAEATLAEQEVHGNIYVDNISELTLSLVEGSHFVGAINAENTAGRLDLVLDASSTLELTADCYVTSLKNEDASGANIKLNGFKLCVGEEKQADNLPETGDDGAGHGGPGGPGGGPGQGGFGGPDGQAPPDGAFDGANRRPPRRGGPGNGRGRGRRALD